MRPFSSKKKAALTARIDELTAQVAEIQSRLSVVDGRSSLNAERNVRTHSSLQNFVEDFESITNQVQPLITERTQARRADPEGT